MTADRALSVMIVTALTCAVLGVWVACASVVQESWQEHTLTELAMAFLFVSMAVTITGLVLALWPMVLR